MNKFETITEYNIFNNHETLHPLVSVIDFSKASPRRLNRTYFGFYMVLLKDVHCGDLRYGKNTYDYQEGTLIFIAPGQILDMEPSVELYQPKGHGVIFHRDLILGTDLGRHIDRFTFFNYHSNEALHISERERQMVMNSLAKIKHELEHGLDKHSRELICANIELLLKYCERYYDRQFITRDHANKGILEKFEHLLNNYYDSEKPETLGLPSVAYFADELNLSANYFGDLMKKETGKSAKEYIQIKIVEFAKRKIIDSHKTAREIAHELGFKYSQHFSRMFKNETGYTPNEFRNLN